MKILNAQQLLHDGKHVYIDYPSMETIAAVQVASAL